MLIIFLCYILLIKKLKSKLINFYNIFIVFYIIHLILKEVGNIINSNFILKNLIHEFFILQFY